MEVEYKQTKVKAAVKLFRNKDPTLHRLVREFEGHASSKGHPSLVMEALCYTNEMGISLDLSHLQPVCKDRDGKDISCEKVKNELKVAAKEIGQDKIRNEKWQGKLPTDREEDQDLVRKACSAWLWEWSECPFHKVAGMYDLYEHLLPTKLFTTSKKTKTTSPDDVMCRLCGKCP